MSGHMRVKSQLEDIQCIDDSDVTDNCATNVDSTVKSQASGETVTGVNVTTDGSTVVNRATDATIIANSDVLAAEQTKDDSLSDCRALARNSKGGYYWHNGLLYHTDNVLGQFVKQLIVPKERRSIVWNLAHDKCGFHQGQKRTSERIR